MESKGGDLSTNMSHLQAHESKDMPERIPPTKIVEAFGRFKCPKLVEQVQSEFLDVRRNTLAALYEEFRNPEVVHGCVEEGIIGILVEMCMAEDIETRVRASKALSMAANDANGRMAMISENVAPGLLNALSDSMVDVRRNTYVALLCYCQMMPAVHQIVEAGYPPLLVEKALEEDVTVKPLVLELLAFCLKDDNGLVGALSAEAVEGCLELCNSGAEDVRREAARCLQRLCFAEMAKVTAIRTDGIETLVELLQDPNPEIRAAAAGALMGVTTVDEGKKAMVPAGGVPVLITLLSDKQKLVKLNTLKVIANIAAYPEIRDEYKNNPDVLRLLTVLERNSDDELIAKHAGIAKRVVLWTP
mmetsp:Transcript_28586/g.37437  ORF Transcript_28586/g.37437 Transcript_28586/m.37437 type:complete len:360 (+) Transcript_28586:50-1129(+)|eukprot:CAMPEP_0117743306 /NCGR_PEP_ID=MMETSP0947-20121206/6058_1 /TAXON_ID=44440 /ORGANISM="Chattonella subsalsa, Strain CCMP2191" /LENGTH=359 /DNA_ID=CAMNT_0005559985 /DNA_START=50 /DNA_END=1132 /DNA_ORIENTATION=+